MQTFKENTVAWGRNKTATFLKIKNFIAVNNDSINTVQSLNH